MMAKYIMTIDEGTSSTRAVIYNDQAQIVTTAQREIKMSYPEPGWVEQDANEIWVAVQSVIATALIQSGVQPDEIAGVGITNQRETTVVWDKATGLPIYPAIVWQSRQTSDIAEALVEKGLTDKIKQTTGLLPDAYFSGTKIRFILDHVAGAQRRAEKGDLLFGTIDTWLLWKLTGGDVHATDYTNASRTMLFDINKLDWDKELLAELNIPAAMLPEVRSSSEVYGTAMPVHFFGAEVPIAGMIGDQQSSLFGQLALEKGVAKNTYGTGSFLVMNTGDEPVYSKNGLVTTIGYGFNGEVKYALEGSVFVSGSALQWLRDGLEMIEKSSESEQLALDSTNENEVFVVPAFTGLGAPYWDSDARGAVFGLTRGTTRGDFVKATLQALAYQSKDVLNAMMDDTGLEMPLLKVDGGASRNNYLMQFQSDLGQIEIERASDVETTAIGAAYLAGLAVGFWSDVDQIRDLRLKGTTFKPKMAAEEADGLYGDWQEAVAATRAFKPRNKREA
jgi:glycerol kinase